ncbi:mast cell protease 1A-like [Rhinatrema bivittatum]|uniref:mast cell protease 1A-like n=1 Tax=Rhinatrema bivittatum TaxID=194408 RepID=UPI00112AC6E9|nr:mast cell protease 1A-like [Rhinatrema bivittatum]
MQISFLLLLALALLRAASARVLRDQIIGGRKVTPHSKPWMALITFSLEGRSWHCGGFLVKEDFVMTAAHCNGTDMKVHLGVHDVKEDKSTWQIFDVKKFYPGHYKPDTKENDIQLLQLHGRARLSKTVQLIPLPKSGSVVPVNSLCNVAGWGNSPVLQAVDVEVISNHECSKALDVKEGSITETMMCAGIGKEDKDASQGDSGGPLVCDGVAEGIVCCGPRHHPPGIYTRISKFMLWVQKVIEH